jgi:probable rRNA maturation factor
MVILKTAVPGVSEQALARFLRRAGKAAGLRGQATVLVTSSIEVRALNRRFRGKDEATDVLSFAAPDSGWPGVRGSKSRATASLRDPAGDIVICAPIAVRNARLYQHPVAQEIKVLILHGLLHLAGYDHESDRGKMARREEKLRREMGLADGLIRRTESCSPAALGREGNDTTERRRR